MYTLLYFSFANGPEPDAPFDEYGVDVTQDDLSCDSYPACEQTSRCAAEIEELAGGEDV